MAYYNPEAETYITIDASPSRLGAILSQEQTDGSIKPISVGSRSLTDTETRYSQTEREALGVMWSLQYYHYYVFDRHVTIYTDHKPLEILLSASSNPPPRIQRWLLRMQGYNYTIKYIKGTQNAADYLSSYALPNKPTDIENITEAFINNIIQDAIPKAVNIDTL